MKFKPSHKGGGVLVELSPNEGQLPSSGEHNKAFALFELKKILVPVDFSECSKKALQYAVPFGKHFGAEIMVVHVMSYPLQGPDASVADGQVIDDTKTALNDLLREISGTVKASGVLRMGNPSAEIIEAAGLSGADLIILATHGKSGLAHLLLGSTAERVVRHAPCPVLVVREKEHEFLAKQSEDSVAAAG